MSVRDRIGWARLDAVSAENAARIIDIVDFCVTLTGGDSICVGVLSRFDVNAIRRASRGAQKAANAFFQSIFIAMQNVDAAIARLEWTGSCG